MKISRISCEQFAGIKDKDVSLTDGFNVIYGANESGKSTMIELIRCLLFRDTELGSRSAADKEFRTRYLPAEVVSGARGDSSDGRIDLSEGDTKFRLEKIWGAESRCVLTENGTKIRDRAAIAERLSEMLRYGEGIYNDVVFPSQHNAYSILASLLEDADSDLRGDLAALMAEAAGSTNGVSAEVLAESIAEKLEQLGQQWDHDRDRPTRRGMKRTGEIYKANEAVEAAEEQLQNIRDAESRANAARRERDRMSDASAAATKAYEDFCRIYEALKSDADTRRLKAAAERELSARKAAADCWEAYSDGVQKAKLLKAELASVEKCEAFIRAEKIHKTLNEAEAQLTELHDIPENAVKKAEKLIAEAAKLRHRLDIDLAAKIKKLGNADIRIISAVTGKEIQLTEELDITEAVIIRIPDVMELHLSPKDVDVDDIASKTADISAELSGIFEKYGVTSVEELSARAEKCSQLRNTISMSRFSLEKELNGRSYEELKADSGSISGEWRSVSQVSSDIAELCGRESLDSYLGRVNGALAGYIEQYSTPAQNMIEIERLSREISGYSEKLNELEKTIGGMAQCADPDSERSRLKEMAQRTSDQAAEASERYAVCMAEYEDISTDIQAAEEELSEKKAELEEKKALYRHWLHIKEVLEKLRSNSSDDPMKGISESFGKYLSIISADRLKLAEAPTEGSTAVVASDNNIVGIKLLSEGTKDTISLAFRLAVLEHLFPDGGGLAVFDDPFTDMDDERRSRAIELIREFAKCNQVIYVTCDSRCKALTDINLINI